MAHARLGIIAVVFAASVEMTSAQTQTQTESPGRTLWDHNGSIVYLIANGSSREFYYQKPRPGMLDVGARPGSLLFRGQLNGQISGTAYFFNLHCGPIPFEVKGAPHWWYPMSPAQPGHLQMKVQDQRLQEQKTWTDTCGEQRSL